MTSYYLPVVLLVAILLTQHLYHRQPWQFEPGMYGWMWLESLVWTIPLYVFAAVLFRETAGPAMAPSGPIRGFMEGLVFAIGAGVYEELLFRLIAITLMMMVLVDLLALPKWLGGVVSATLAAVAFSAYHFTGEQEFELELFLFYAGIGGYLGVIFLWRGMGVVVGVHALYDVLVELTRFLQGTG
jgi:hypothetical protein